MVGKVALRNLGSVCAVVCLCLLATAASAGAHGWSIQPTPPLDPGDPIPAASFSGVSCPTVDSCAAVGFEGFPGGSGALVELWDGSTWSSPLFVDTGFEHASPLLGVSCAAPDACLAVGYGEDGEHADLPQAIQVVSNGAGDVSPPPPEPFPPEGSSAFNAVSCTATTQCIAAGSQFGSGLQGALFADRWDGTNWEDLDAADPGASGSPSFAGISCTSGAWCEAVGGDGNTAIAKTWDGTAWSVNPIPTPAGVASWSFSSVSCPSQGNCVAVGQWSLSPGLFAAYLRDGAWSSEPLPAPATATAIVAAAVSCPTPRTCEAVGTDSETGGVAEAFALRLHHGRWHPQALPAVPGAASDELASVSCPTRHLCTAVGTAIAPVDSDGFAASTTLAEQWTGGDHRHHHHGHRFPYGHGHHRYQSHHGQVRQRR